MSVTEITGWLLFFVIGIVLITTYLIIELVLYVKLWLYNLTEEIGNNVDEAFSETEMKELE